MLTIRAPVCASARTIASVEQGRDQVEDSDIWQASEAHRRVDVNFRPPAILGREPSRSAMSWNYSSVHSVCTPLVPLGVTPKRCSTEPISTARRSSTCSRLEVGADTDHERLSVDYRVDGGAVKTGFPLASLRIAAPEFPRSENNSTTGSPFRFLTSNLPAPFRSIPRSTTLRTSSL